MAAHPYAVRLTRSAEKDLRGLRTHEPRVIAALGALLLEPRKGHSLAGRLKGVRSLEFSLPGGPYRAAYLVDDTERVCRVFAIGPHENFYRLAERRLAALQRDGTDDTRTVVAE